VDEMKNSCIRLIRHEQNRGGGAARNTGVRASINEWVFNLDADNVIHGDLIHRLLDFAVTNEIDVACPSTIHFFKGDISEISHDWAFEDRDITFLDHLSSPYVPSASGNYLFSRAAFERAGGFPEFAFLDTWGFGLRMVATGSRMRICPSTSYFHRFGHESYYVRESRRVARQSLIATSLVLEFPDLSSPRIIRKLLSRRHRFSWFSKIQKNPFKIRNQASGRVISY
jgi:GT2 family glycosyltransferase